MPNQQRERLARPLTGEGLDEDLHAAAQAQHQVQRALLLDVVVGQGAPILQLLARKDQALLVRGDALLVLQQGARREGETVTLHSSKYSGPVVAL